MTNYKKTTILALTVSCLSANPVHAYWALDTDTQATRSSLIEKQITQINANSYFKISQNEIVTPTTITTSKVAIISGASIDKIINVNPGDTLDVPEDTVIISVPDELGVKYVDADGNVKLEAINQGDIVTVANSSTPVPTPITSPAVSDPKASTITAVTVLGDNSVTAVITPPSAGNNETVHVQVITNGRSNTSVGTDNAGTPVTVNSLPQNSNVTVETVITNTQTGSQTVIQNTVVTTPAATIETPTPARDATVDKTTIEKPVVSSNVSIDATGHKNVSVSVPVIPNFDPSRTNVQLMIVGESGATTAVGADGNGGTINVGSLSPNENYTVKVVIRDLATGQETVITGDAVTK